jgi:glycosyltransferase involved in cell wall biosynthesis
MATQLRIGFLIYRGNPYSGGQGVYTRHLTRELAALGHEVTVFSGPPYPTIDRPVALVKVPSLNLYRHRYPFWVPLPWELRTAIDWLEFGLVSTGQFPEAHTFSYRVTKLLDGRWDHFDVVHDNQSLGRAFHRVIDEGRPFLATIHHPITVDRDLELAHAESVWRRARVRRWYSFLPAQIEVARRLEHMITVSESSRTDIAKQMGVLYDRIGVVAVGVDHERFKPRPEIARVPGRVFTTSSADVPLKGLVPLLEAIALVRQKRAVELVVVGKQRQGSTIPSVLRRLGLGENDVRFVHGVSDTYINELYAQAEVAVVPSLYEGFSLPAIEAMASGTPLVATTGGALPEVVGTEGAARLVPPNEPSALAEAILTVLDSAAERRRLSEAGRARVLERFTWRVTAEETAAEYERYLASRR